MPVRCTTQRIEKVRRWRGGLVPALFTGVPRSRAEAPLRAKGRTSSAELRKLATCLYAGVPVAPSPCYKIWGQAVQHLADVVVKHLQSLEETSSKVCNGSVACGVA